MGMVPPSLQDPYSPHLHASNGPTAGLYWPVALAIVALIIWFSFQLSQILAARHQLLENYRGQEVLMLKATRLRSTIDALADGTSRLAAGGNQNAKRFIDAMAKRGITFNPPKDLLMKPSENSAPKSNTQILRPTGDPNLRPQQEYLKPSSSESEKKTAP